MSMGRVIYCWARYQRYSRIPGGRSGRDTVSKHAVKASLVRTSRKPVPRCTKHNKHNTREACKALCISG